MEMWEKTRSNEHSSMLDQANNPTAASANHPAGATNLISDAATKINLSPDFKKKYEQWQKMKHTPGLPTDHSFFYFLTHIDRLPGEASSEVKGKFMASLKCHVRHVNIIIKVTPLVIIPDTFQPVLGMA